MDNIHGERVPGQKPAESFPFIEEAAEECDQRKAHPHGEDRVPQREDGRLPTAIADERAAQAEKRRREQYDCREHGQNETQLPERTGDRPKPFTLGSEYPDQEKAQVLREIAGRREIEYRQAVRYDDPQQVAGRRQRKREDGHGAEREPPVILRRRVLRPVPDHHAPRQVAQVEDKQHYGEPHRPQGKQAGRCITCKRLLSMRANSRNWAKYEDVNERGDAEPEQPVL